MNAKANFSVQLPSADRKRLEVLAKQYALTPGAVMRLALRELPTPAERKRLADMLEHISNNVLAMFCVSNRRNQLMTQLALRLGQSGLAADPAVAAALGEFGTVADVEVERDFAALPQMIDEYRGAAGIGTPKR